jgi:group I intron endonuclease
MAYLPDPGCYRVRCVVNGRQYIGSSLCVKARLADHLKKLRQGASRCNSDMLADFRRFGETSFRFEVIRRCNPEERLELEQSLLHQCAKNLYNGSRTASHRGPKDLKPEVRAAMSRSAKARCTPQWRKTKSLLMKQLRAERRL